MENEPDPTYLIISFLDFIRDKATLHKTIYGNNSANDRLCELDWSEEQKLIEDFINSQK